MIPAKLEQFLKNLNEPDFFIRANRDACNEIHDHVKELVKNGTETLEVEIDAELLRKVENVLHEYGWTVEESLMLFLLWCVVCPGNMNAWYKKIKDGESNEETSHAVQT